MYTLKYIIIFLFVIIITISSLSQVNGEPTTSDEDYLIEIFATGLKFPTTMDFIENDILVLEKNTGKVIRIKNNGIMYDEPVLDVAVRYNFYSGLLGITALSDRVFLYYTESASGSDAKEPGPNAKNRVYQYEWDGEKLTNPILVKELIAQEGDDHHGGVITSGQNGEIYFAIGDQNQSGIFENVIENPCYKIDFVNDECSSEPIYETSSIFRINTNQNNHVTLFAMGIRNSFGLGVDPITGYLWDTENGLDHYDEINLVKPRFNSGWNSVMGPSYRDNPDDSVSQTIPDAYGGFVYSEPEFSWYDPVGPTALAFPNMISFEKYSDWLFVGDYHHGRIYKFQLNSDRTGFIFSDQRLTDLVLDKLNDKTKNILFAKGFKTVSDIEFRHDAMYVVSIANGSIYKIYPKDPIPPLKQYQADIAHQKIVCKPGLMPIMKNSGSVSCVYPKTAVTLIRETTWSINHPEMPIIKMNNQNLSGLDFEHINLSNSDFRNANFTTTNIVNVNFTGANLSGAKLEKANASNANLAGVDLSFNNLTEIRLDNANLSDATLTKANLSYAILTGANLSNANLASTDLSGKNLSNTNLVDAILVEADLSYTILRGADLTGADLTYADLTNANLSGAKLNDAIIDDAILSCIGHKICKNW